MKNFSLGWWLVSRILNYLTKIGSYESVEGKIHYNTKRLIINYLELKLV